MMSDDLVSVMVPRKYLSKVYGLIATLDSHPARGGESQGPPQDARDENGSTISGLEDWTSSRIRKMVEQSPPAMRDLLRAMAKKPNQWITTKDLASAIEGNEDANTLTVAGTLGAFGRRVKHRYGIDVLPFESRYDHEAHSRVLRMAPEIAKQVLNSLGGE